MKNKILLTLVAFCMAGSVTKAQTFRCGTVATSTAAPAASVYCSGMASGQYVHTNNFLDDFIPRAADNNVTVNVHFWVFTPTVGIGSWGSSSASDADFMLYSVNSGVFSNTTTPGIIIPGVPQPPVNSKIEFVRSGFNVVPNQAVYQNIDLAPLTYNDPNAINIYYGSACATQTDCQTYVWALPDNHIYCNTISPQNIGSQAYVIGHELGHALGLKHVVDYENYSEINVPESCCGTIWASDAELMTPATFSIGNLCNTPGVTNNVMSYNWACQRYFSPRQIGIMHYHLRTSMQNVLVPASRSYVLNANPAFDYTVTANETWDYDRYFKGNVVVNPNVKLTIKCLVGMTNGGKIGVKKKAQLVVDGGTVTNLSGQLWAGVKVHGDVNGDQVTNNSTGFGDFQGVLRIINGGTLSRSGTAVTNYGTDASDAALWNEVGGIIITSSANFLNNARDVEFYAYGPQISVSRFYNTQFKTTASLNANAGLFAHVTMWGIKGIQFNGCNFEYAAGSAYSNGAHGMGIYSIDAGYAVNQLCAGSTTACAIPSTFKKLDRGVMADNLSPVASVSIYNSQFLDNWPDAIYMHNMNYSVLDQNYIRTTGMFPVGCGVYLNTCKQYNVRNNTLLQAGSNKADPGIYAYNSQAGAHQIYRNNFNNFYSAINAVDNNSGVNNIETGLQINCNDFTPGKSLFDVALTGTTTGLNSPTVKREQGLATSNPNDLVRNKYYANCGTQNQWYTVINSTKVILHPSNLDAITQPLPQPSCSNPLVQVSIIPILLDYVNHCPTSQVSSGGGGAGDPHERLTNINQYIRTIQTSGGTAFELESAVAAKTKYYLSDTLLSSQDTIIDILNRNPGHFDDADIQVIFAYMGKGAFATAISRTNALGANRADWKTLLSKLIAIYQETDKIYSLLRPSTGYKSFMVSYASTDKDGHGIAQALLKFVCGIDYSEPRPLPNTGSEGGRTSEIQAVVGTNEISSSDNLVSVFPNPTEKGITVQYQASNEEKADVKIELRDLLDKLIYTNFIDNVNNGYISLSEYNAGVYIITVTKNKQLLYKSKVIKQN